MILIPKPAKPPRAPIGTDGLIVAVLAIFMLSPLWGLIENLSILYWQGFQLDERLDIYGSIKQSLLLGVMTGFLSIIWLLVLSPRVGKFWAMWSPLSLGIIFLYLGVNLNQPLQSLSLSSDLNLMVVLLWLSLIQSLIILPLNLRIASARLNNARNFMARMAPLYRLSLGEYILSFMKLTAGSIAGVVCQ